MKPTRKLTIWTRPVLPLAAIVLLSAIRTVSALDYPSTVRADNPIAYWRLEETSGTTAFDSSASGAFPGSYVQNGIYPIMGAPGIDTNSVTFSSSVGTDFVYVPYTDALNQPGPFSFEIWARPVSFDSANYRSPIGNSPAYNTATGSGWYVYQSPQSGSTPAEWQMVTPTGDVYITTTNITLFAWQYLAGTYDGTNMSFYVNGVLAGTQRAGAYVANSVNNANECYFGIGIRGDLSYYGNFDGGLDEAAFYTNALNLTQIQTHYQVGTNSFRAAALPPTISTQPAPTTVYAGATAHFSVQADGTAPLYYQWYNGASLIAGATSSSYSFTTTPAENGNLYSVTISNSVGTTNSSAALLTVSTGLQIDAPATSIIRNVGSSAAFEVVAEGAQPLSYQWYNGATSAPISGATNNVLWLYNVQATNDGSTYYVTITNPYTNLSSSAATLNVQSRPVTIPATKYAAVVEADGPVAYWRLDEPNGSAIATDAVGSFDGTYTNLLAGTFTYGYPTGIPHETDGAIGITNGAVVEIPYSIEINPTGAFSVDGWFLAGSLPNNSGNDYRIPISSISNPYGQGPTGWLVYQTGGNNWSWWPYNGNYGGIQLYDYDQIVVNQWYYLAMTYDGATFTFYVNGVARASSPDSGFVPNGNVPAGYAANYNYNYNVTPGLPSYNGIGSGDMVLGWRFDQGFNPFPGAIDDVAVYNKALTPTQIQSHFANSTRLSYSTAGNKIVLTWPVGTLQASTNVLGGYTNVTSAVSPYTNTMTGRQLYYRVKVQ